MDEETCVLETCEPESQIYEDVRSEGAEDDANSFNAQVIDSDTGPVEEDHIEEENVEYVDDGSEGHEPEHEESSDSDDIKSLVVINNNSDDFSLHDDESKNPSHDPSYVSSYMSTNDYSSVSCEKSQEGALKESFEGDNEDLIFRLKEAENRYSELESRLFMFEEKFNDINKKISENLESNNDMLSTINSDLQSRADNNELRKLKKDFDQFSKRLRRVVQAEDSANAESLDATKVPPDVLEITYAKTLNDIYNAMLGIYGDREAVEMVEAVRDSVREFSAGVDFFRFEHEAFVVRGLSEAISSKIVSVKQIHGTYVELFKKLYQYVPNYNTQDFRSFVETGSKEYTIEKVVEHEECLEKINTDKDKIKDELANITENVSFMAELQNNQLEETASNSQAIEELKEQMKSVAKAVNLHTKAISKLNKTLKGLEESGSVNISSISSSDVDNETIPSFDPSEIKELIDSKISKEDIEELISSKINTEDIEKIIDSRIDNANIGGSNNPGLSKEEIEELVNSKPDRKDIEELIDSAASKEYIEELVSSKLSKGDIEEILDTKAASKDDIMAISGEMESFKASVEDMLTSMQQQFQEDLMNSEKSKGMQDEMSCVQEDPDLSENTGSFKLTDMPIEEVITLQLSTLGSATLKQLEKQIKENGYPIDFEKLSLVMSYLEQEQLVSSTKKGRYTFYSVTDLRNV